MRDKVKETKKTERCERFENREEKHTVKTSEDIKTTKI